MKKTLEAVAQGMLVLLATFCLTKSLSCKVAALTRISYDFRVFKYLEFISLIWKKSCKDKFQYLNHQEGYFRVPRRFCAVYNSAKVRSLVSVRTGLRSFRTPICVLEDSASLACICPNDRGTSFRLFSVLEKDPESFVDMDWEVSLQPFRR
jgi:hypothetical protein